VETKINGKPSDTKSNANMGRMLQRAAIPDTELVPAKKATNAADLRNCMLTKIGAMLPLPNQCSKNHVSKKENV
jgi:hypothetical protein